MPDGEGQPSEGEGKVCTQCGEWKSFSSFHKRKLSKDGLRPNCKACKKERVERYYKENRDVILKKHKRYREKTAHSPVVYFWQNPLTRHIKIGFTTRRADRRGQLNRQHGVEFQELRTMPGDYALEYCLHKTLDGSRTEPGNWSCEYFHPTKEVWDIINGPDLEVKLVPVEKKDEDE